MPDRTAVEPKKETAPQVPLTEVYTLANFITVGRLLLVPIFFVLLISGGNRILSTALYALAASTDWLDGQIARRTKTVSELGKLLDPFVDRLLLAAGVIGLWIIGSLPLWIVIVLVIRDSILLGGSFRLARKGGGIDVIFLGKLTTALLLTGFTLMLLDWPQIPGLGLFDLVWLPGFSAEPVGAGIWLVYAGVLLSVSTAFMYTRRYRTLARDGENG